MNSDPVRLDPTRVSAFFQFCAERQRIYRKRQRGQAHPWTKDPVLRDWAFTNVFREQDAVTSWLREQWRDRYEADEMLWFAMCVARAINWPPTLAEIGYPVPWDGRRVKSKLLSRKGRGEKVYTSAYQICHGGHVAKAGLAHYVVDCVLSPLWRRRGRLTPELFATGTIQGFVQTLAAEPQWGNFMAYEVAKDVSQTLQLCDAGDRDSWAHVGPGSKAGLVLLSLGQPPVGDAARLATMRTLLPKMRTALGRSDPAFKTAELADVEHALCEFYKYTRIGAGGKGKQRYRPERPRGFVVVQDAFGDRGSPRGRLL